MAAQRCETLSGFDWDVMAATQGSRYAALRGNPGLPYASPSGYFIYRNPVYLIVWHLYPAYASPSGYFIYRNFLRTNAQKADGL
jgi:hypothetical protein